MLRLGTYSYGGIYYEGDHKYSMDKFFLEHPECVGKSADGEPLYVQFKGKHGYKLQAQGCPSNKVLHEYMLESFDWLFKEIPEASLTINKITSGITDYEILRRWQYLASFLNGYYWEANQKFVGSEWFDSDGVGDNVERK